MAGAKKIEQVVSILRSELEKDKLVVVVSAMGKTTDALLNAGELAAKCDEHYKELLSNSEKEHLETVKSLIPVSQQSSVLSKVKTLCNDIEDICNGAFLLGELSLRTKDRLLSYGEILSSCILSSYLKSLNIGHEWKDSRELIRTNTHYNLAAVDFDVTNKQITEYFNSQSSLLIVLPGFIASDESNNTTTLGRGGSDYTASIIAAALGATVLQIWTDVSGIMTADPRIVNNARIINRVSYQEAMELSHFGAKVIYPPTIQPVMKKNIPVHIKNTFSPEHEGSRIESESPHIKNGICGISGIPKIALLSLEGSGMLGVPGFSKRLFEALAKENINVILITQSSSEHSICVGVDESMADKAKRVVDISFDTEIASGLVNSLIVEKQQAIVALIGDNMKSHPGISGKMFNALGRNGINVRAIAQGASERNISAVVASGDMKKAMNV
ncbi:MAG: aspartate kinase, partial [Chitinophagaceae bacterium]|nr:aspartate kinase [Chitinophagaceae bacterium]